jgi:putative endonuclease
MSNTKDTVLYVGMTNDLARRMYEHKNHLDKDSFTSKYNVTKLVHFEMSCDVDAAIEREKQIKSWKRNRKIALVMESNPRMIDLYDQIVR